jgi:hypothetical protein
MMRGKDTAAGLIAGFALLAAAVLVVGILQPW